MPPEIEEAVLGADLRAAQHFGPDRRQPFFGRGQRGRRALSPRGLHQGDLRQAAAVDLAARGEGQGFERDEDRGYHGLGQPSGKDLAESRNARLRGGHERHQPGAGPAHLRESQNRRRFHPGKAREDALDLPGLDPETPHLNLLVGAAEILQPSRQLPARQIAALVEPPSRLSS